MSPQAVVGERYSVLHVVSDPERPLVAAYAYDIERQETVFVKAKSTAADNGHRRIRARLEREADILESLCHPQIPKLLDADVDREFPRIVTTCMPGNTYIRKWFRKYPAPEMAARLCLSALEPLDYMHERGLTHRDVKTSNLVLQWGGRVSLIDLELALCEDEQIAEQFYQRSARKDPRITSTNHIIGTASYISPEAVLGHRPTPKSDIYSLGIVLHELLYGRVPFEGEDSEVMMKQVREEIPFDRFASEEGLQRRVPRRLHMIVNSATVKQPELRYESLLEMKEDIQSYLRGD